MLLSLLFPGLGDFYIGHSKIAVMEILLASIMWLGVVLDDPQKGHHPEGEVQRRKAAMAGVPAD